jgi:hypothetical protein
MPYIHLSMPRIIIEGPTRKTSPVFGPGSMRLRAEHILLNPFKTRVNHHFGAV